MKFLLVIAIAILSLNTLNVEFCFAQTTPISWNCDTIQNSIIWKKAICYVEQFQSFQSINVIDVDLNNVDVKIDFLNSKDKFKSINNLVDGSGVIVAINGSYPDRDKEKRWGTFFKRNDSIYQTIEYPDNHPLYWKSEGCILINSMGKIDILQGNKHIYENLIASNVMSSAPVLVLDGKPVGKNYLPDTLNLNELGKLDYESPFRHQGIRHPRTAIGITSNNHFLMVVVDGRNEKAAGMNVVELTTLMYDFLGCYEAINLDGGGSSSMWIKGQPFNGVVNYPTDNNKFDHEGCRKISMAITISKI